MNKLFCSVSALLCSFMLCAADGDFNRALSLYQNGLYAQSMSLFQSMPEYGSDPMVDGYVVLCAQKQHSNGYEKLVEGYLDRYSSCSLCRDIEKELAFDLFDRQKYQQALEIFNRYSVSDYEKKQRAEYLFKKGYSCFVLDDFDPALGEFARVEALSMNDYTAPAQYVSGYILYGRAEFGAALDKFLLSARDERMRDISNYYIVNCYFEQKDYDNVISLGEQLFQQENTPADRKARLARLISESYLVKGDKDMARQFYGVSEDGTAKTRADYFYAGSLMYATGDYKEAVENFNKMGEKTDSLGQIALYQSALAYMQIKNKVASYDSFRQASQLYYDPKITEDAFFNYAKLAFDLNRDSAGFAEYMARYADNVRGEQIYSYMALAALSDKDYQSAIDNYDKIDELQGQDKGNYVRANYLRGAELLNGGSYRKASQCFKAVTYYSDRDETVNQLSRYFLADSYYRNAQYSDARKSYTELYNASALYGLVQSELLAYNIAYSYLKEEDYANAGRWFDKYCADGGKTYAKDAAVRKADCLYVQKSYADAIKAYQDVLDNYYDVNDIYPYYQAALCQGLVYSGSNRKTIAANRKKKIELLSKVLDADPSAPYYGDAYFELGRTQQADKRLKDAVATYRGLTEKLPLSPYAAQALLEIGTIKRTSGDSKAALEAYKTVVETMQNSGYAEDALLAIESVYQSQNAPKKYLEYLESIGRGATKTEAEKEEMIYSAAEQIYFSDNYTQALIAFDEFRKAYPESGKTVASWYYTGCSYDMLHDKEQACDAFSKVMQAPENAYTENAMRSYASISYSLENYEDAFRVYTALSEKSKQAAGVHDAKLGVMRSAWKSKRYGLSADYATMVIADTLSNADVVREAKMTKARSLLSVSRRDEAFAVLEDLSAEVKTPEGAEAAYMVIVDLYDRAEFDKVKDKVYAFSDSGTNQQYYLAKAFIVLGDTFAEEGRLKQAKATFQSIAEGYSDNAEINEELKMRLQKLEEMN